MHAEIPINSFGTCVGKVEDRAIFENRAVLEAKPFLREPLLEVELFSEVITNQIMKYQVMNHLRLCCNDQP
jgi:hypothetical protein